MRHILAIAAVLLTSSASASHLSFEIQAFSADFDVNLDGRAASGDFPNLRIESSGASVTGSFGEILELNEVITVTISDYAANASQLYEDFILPQIFSPPLDPGISSDPVGFQNNVLLWGRNLFGRTYGVEMITALLGTGQTFDRQVSLEVADLGFISGGILDDNIVDALLIEATVSPLQQFLFSGSSPQVLTFDSTLRFQVNSVVTSAVPVPATVWLFGTGILGLIGFSKRRKAT
jgi:hypothetical protein